MSSVPNSTVILAIILIAIVIAIAAWAIVQRQRSIRLKRRFGPEYDATVSDLHSRGKAEAELEKREQRVASFQLVPLTADDAVRFSQTWNAVQSRFIDSPKGVVVEANQLVRQLMAARGYPMDDFERMAADISVDHPSVVSTYRAAQAIANRDARGEANTEELRKAVIYYRTLFDELLGLAPNKATPLPPARRVPVHS